MKPDSQISRQPSRSDQDVSSSRSAHPLIDYPFHAAPARLKANGSRINNRSKRSVFAPGFRNLSNEFLGAETRRSYVAEFLFFALIAGISAWPIVSMAQALAQLTK